MTLEGVEEMPMLSPCAVVSVEKAVDEGALKRNSRRKSVARSDEVVLVSEKADTVGQLPVKGVKLLRNLRSRRGKMIQEGVEEMSFVSPCHDKRAVKSKIIVKGGGDEGVGRPPDKIAGHEGNEGIATKRQLRSKQVTFQDSQKDDDCEAIVVNDGNLLKRGWPRKSRRPVEVGAKDDAAVNENQDPVADKPAELVGFVDGNDLGKRGRTRKLMVLQGKVKAGADTSVSKEQEIVEGELAVFSPQMAADNKRRNKGRKNTLIVRHQGHKRGMEQVLEDVEEGTDGHSQVLENKDSRKEGLQSKGIDEGPKGLQGLRRSSRRAAKFEADAAVNEQAVDVNLCSMEKHDIVSGRSTPASGLIESRKPAEEEQYQGIGSSTPGSQKTKNNEEETLCSSNSSLQLRMVYQSLLSKPENMKEATPSSSDISLQLWMAYESTLSKLSKDTRGSKATFEVDASLCEPVVDDNDLQSKDKQQEGNTRGLKHAEAVRADHISAKDTLSGGSTEADSISENRKSDEDSNYRLD